MKTHVLLFTAIFAGFVAVNAPATTTHYVDANGTNPVAPYLSWATAATNIQDAVAYSTTAHIVLVTNGVYQYGGNVNNGSSNRVSCFFNGITIRSVNGPAVTTIVGNQVPGTIYGINAARCAYLSSGSVLSGFTLTNGATQTGMTGDGGGVYCADTTCLVTNCVIVGNVAYSTGGGVYLGTLVNSVLKNNSAHGTSGGGIDNGSGTSLVINCLLTGNTSSYVGSAADGCTLINCTIAGNSGYLNTCQDCQLKNCISYYNTAGTVDGSDDFSTYSNCCVTGMPTYGNSMNNFTNPPLFINWTNGDFHLTAVSPCINVGNNSLVTNTIDLDGNPRIVGGIVDLGAYEFQTAVHYVSWSNAAAASPYTNWATAAGTIQMAIDAANAGDFIIVSNGVYNTGGRVQNGSLTNCVVENIPVTVESVNGPAVTTILGRVGTRCAYLTNGAALFGFTMTNGQTFNSQFPIYDQSGAGVWCQSSSATVSNCIFAGNVAEGDGGGAFGGTLINCYLTNNTAGFGGGTSSNTLFNCTLIHNSAVFNGANQGGGAYYCTLSNCQIVGNQSLSTGTGGGAAYSTLASCVVSNNSTASSGGGGGLFECIASDTLISSNRTGSGGFGGGAYSNTLYNCLIENNFAFQGGGGDKCVLFDCTVVSNTAPIGSGAQNCEFTNCIVYYNGNVYGGNVNDSTLAYCDTFPAQPGVGNITNTPVFVNLTGDDFHLQSSSPCINSGNNAYVVGITDFDGNPRIQGGTVDMGAYEYQSPVSMVSYQWLEQYGLSITNGVDTSSPNGTAFDVYQDWKAGLDPTNPASVLVVIPPAPTNNASGITVTWQSVTNISYFLQRATDLSAQPPFTTIQSNITGHAGTTSYKDTAATNPVPYFYRVGVP